MAQPGKCRVAQCLHLVFHGDIADRRQRPVAGGGVDRVSRFAEPALVKVADQQRRAFLGSALGDGEADAGPGGGGDDDGLALQQPGGGGVRGDSAAHRVPRGSRGMPSARSAMMLRWIWLVPP